MKDFENSICTQCTADFCAAIKFWPIRCVTKIEALGNQIFPTILLEINFVVFHLHFWKKTQFVNAAVISSI